MAHKARLLLQHIAGVVTSYSVLKHRGYIGPNSRAKRGNPEGNTYVTQLKKQGNPEGNTYVTQLMNRKHHCL